MSAMAISGGGLSAQLMFAMNEMSKDLRSELRERAENEANRALQEGLAEANELHEKADDQLTGAIVGGVVTGLGAGAQLYSAASMKTQGSGMAEVKADAPADFKAAQRDANAMQAAIVTNTNQKMGMLGNAGGTVSTMGKLSQDIFNAKAGDHEANARAHAAQAQAASRGADVARSSEQEAKQLGDKARDAHGQLLALEHAGTMAVLRG